MAPKELTLAMEHWGRAESKEKAAFEDILALHQRRVIRTALHLLGNIEDAKDAAQEVFLRLHRFGERIDKDKDLGPWLYRVTVNVCHDLRGKRVELQLEDGAAEPSCDDELDLGMDLADRRDLVRRALKRLPEKERAAIVLRDIEGLSTLEAAEALGSSETTVRSQISTGRAKLRDICVALMKSRCKK